MTSLAQYLIDQRRRFPGATGDFNAVILEAALACKAMARAVALGRLARLAPAAMAPPCPLADCYPRGKYLLAFQALDGPGNLEVDLPAGSIFSLLRTPDEALAGELVERHLLQAGERQLAAGYALYGPATQLVLSVGNGVAGFTLDRELGEFMLTHPDLRIPPAAQEFAIDAANRHCWDQPVRRYVDECQAGREGPRGKDFHMRWIASLVAEAHRILLRGGVYLVPGDRHGPARAGGLRLLHEANPVAFLVEQAGGRASTGGVPVLGLQPRALQQRTGLVFGSREEVERIDRYHAEPGAGDSPLPLFAERTLFRVA